MAEKVCCEHAAFCEIYCCLTRFQGEDGPIDKPKTVDEVRQEPYNLPDR
jgi:hypothetical protein